MAVIVIDYIDGDAESYKAVYITYGDRMEKKERFDSGDIVKDWYDCMKFVIKTVVDLGETIMYSSSVGHVLSDLPGFDWAILVTARGKEPVLYYNIGAIGLDFIVKDGTTPTWKELKERCDDKSEKG